MNLKLKNNITEIILSDNFIPAIGSYKKRIKVGNRYGKDGGYPIGDNKVSARKLTLKYEPAKEDDESYLNIINELTGFFRAGLEPYYLIDTDNSRQCEIILGNSTDNPVDDGLTYRIGDNKIDLTMLDGHWEDYIATIIEETISNNDEVIVENTSYAICYPIITLEPTSLNANFILRNLKTGGALELSSNSFVSGSKFIIDSTNEGTIFLDNGISIVESSNSLTDGSGFLYFEPGTNKIKYESFYGDIDIKIEYRKRYAF